MAWQDLVAGMDDEVLALLGGPTTYDPAGASLAVSVTGIFDAAYVRVEAGEAGVSSAGPAVFYRLADLPVDPLTDDPTITIDGVAYGVIETQKCGQGGVLLQLHKV